jgi:5'-methylthioadenosine phosphorylase
MPSIACIGGSMAYRLMSNGGLSGKDLGPQETPFGQSAPVHEIGQGSEGFYFLSRHGEHGYHTAASFVNYRANVWALKALGVERIIGWSGPGAINKKLTPGSIVIVDDLVDETRRRESTFYELGGLGFIRQWPVFCEDCRQALAAAAKKSGMFVHQGGTYVCTEGPRLETPAEIRKFAAFGGDLVGMTLVPEAFLARELEMCYAAVCYVTNFAEGVARREYQAGVRFEGMTTAGEETAIEAAVNALPVIVREAVRTLNHGAQRDCPCSQSMARYRRRGDIGSDWRKWIEPGGGA